MVKTIPKATVKKINKKLVECLDNYRKFMNCMAADLPIGCLCLPECDEKALLDNNIRRVFELFDLDLTEIKGLSESGRRNLTACLNEFLSMS